jgi:serine/threonine protein kinase
MHASSQLILGSLNRTKYGSTDILQCAASDLIDGRYELLDEIGRGGMSVVYRAKDHQLDRHVAVKMLNRKYSSDVTAVKRFRREAIAASSINHPNIVGVYGFGVFNGKPYIAMEYVEGVSLSDFLKQNGPLTREEAVPIFSQICDALAQTHKRGIVHRDLKPSNILLVGPDREVRIVDFGIAKIMPVAGKEIQQLTSSMQIFGTASYMSPEQCVGDVADERSDIYALGCIMYEVITGRVAFEADSTLALLRKQVEDAPAEDVRLRNAFGSVIFQALEKAAEDRPQSMDDLRKSLIDPARGRQKFGLTRIPSEAVLCTALLISGILIGFSAARQFGSAELGAFRTSTPVLVDCKLAFNGVTQR